MLISEKPLKVIEVREGKALVRMERFSVCADCKSMILPPQTQIFEIEIDDKVCIEEGDFVRVGIPGEKLIFYSFALYIFPLAGLIGGTITGHIIRQMFVFSLRKVPLEFLTGFTGLLSPYLIIRRLDRLISRKKGYLPVIIKKIKVKKELLKSFNLD